MISMLAGGKDAIWISPARVCVEQQSDTSAGNAWPGGCLARLLHRLARNYAGLFNGRHGRPVTLWNGRYKACPVDSGNYSLARSRYIELKSGKSVDGGSTGPLLVVQNGTGRLHR